MMIRRIAVKRLQLLRVLDGAEFSDVELAVGIQLHAKHVIDTDMRNNGARQVWPLRQKRAHEQPAVAATFHSKFRGAGVKALDEVLGSGDKVVKHVLFAR